MKYSKINRIVSGMGVCMLLLVCIMASCTSHPSVPQNYTQENGKPEIYPDYTDVVVPPNIAPLNFAMRDIDNIVARFTYGSTSVTYGEGRKVLIDEEEWKELLGEAKGGDIKVEVFAEKDGKWKAYKPFCISVAEEEIDPYISYRLIFPSYVAYEMLNICQRDLTGFEEKDIYTNTLVQTESNGQCINCHSYQNYKTDNIQFHMRQGLGGTMILHDGKLTKINMKNDSVLSAGVYPSWHPELPLIAYSTNHTGQSFHTRDRAKIEVQDTESDLILYDVEKNEVTTISGLPEELECFPWWSPEGDMLYFGSAHFVYQDTVPHATEIIHRFKEVKYNIYRKSFDRRTNTFGETELVYDAAANNMSASFPRISPDGKYLLTAMGEFGCFHVWHPDADLYMMDMKTGKMRKLENVNSNCAESYHSWSSNSRWIMFISRRDDNNFSRLYFAYIDRNGKAHKAFELPQRDPDFYTYFMRSYNVPEFMKEPVKVTPQEFAAAARKDAVDATYRPTGKGMGMQPALTEPVVGDSVEAKAKSQGL